MRILIVSKNRLRSLLLEKEVRSDIRKRRRHGVQVFQDTIDSMKTSSFVELEYIWNWMAGITIEDKRQQEELKIKSAFWFSCISHFFFPGKQWINSTMVFATKLCGRYFTIFRLILYMKRTMEILQYVNEKFCEALMEIIKPDDIIWIHDYHLMLLPGLLKKKFPDNPVWIFLNSRKIWHYVLIFGSCTNFRDLMSYVSFSDRINRIYRINHKNRILSILLILSNRTKFN